MSIGILILLSSFFNQLSLKYEFVKRKPAKAAMKPRVPALQVLLYPKKPGGKFVHILRTSTGSFRDRKGVKGNEKHPLEDVANGKPKKNLLLT